jgi:hypothetical protein
MDVGDFLTSIDEDHLHVDLRPLIFLNPAGDYLTIKTHEEKLPCEFFIRDVFGRSVISASLDDEFTTLDIHGLSPGIYLVIIGEPWMQALIGIKK